MTRAQFIFAVILILVCTRWVIDAVGGFAETYDHVIWFGLLAIFTWAACREVIEDVKGPFRRGYRKAMSILKPNQPKSS